MLTWWPPQSFGLIAIFVNILQIEPSTFHLRPCRGCILLARVITRWGLSYLLCFPVDDIRSAISITWCQSCGLPFFQLPLALPSVPQQCSSLLPGQFNRIKLRYRPLYWNLGRVIKVWNQLKIRKCPTITCPPFSLQNLLASEKFLAVRGSKR